jgi:hypothetical protein
MPRPTTKLARTRPDIVDSLTEFSLEANNNKMIATELFPVFNAPAQAGNFGVLPIEALLEDSDTARASGAAYGRGNYEFEEQSFATKENGWEETVDERDEAIYADYFDADLVAASRARSKILINQEKRVAALTMGSGTMDTTAVSAGIWNASNGTAAPIVDVEAAVKEIWDRTGLYPDTMVLSYWAFRALRNVAEILDRINSAGAGDRTVATDVTTQQLAEVFDIPNILVAGGINNSAAKGQDAVVASLWDEDKCLICKRISSGDIQEPGLGRTFHWSDDGSVIGGRVESYYEDQTRSEVIRMRHETHEKVLMLATGELITGIKT